MRAQLQVIRGHSHPPSPPINLHEYQNKGFTKFAIRKWLILKDAILVVGDWQTPKWLTEKRKAGARSRRLNVVLNGLSIHGIREKARKIWVRQFEFDPYCHD